MRFVFKSVNLSHGFTCSDSGFVSGYRISRSKLNATTGIEGFAGSSSLKCLAARRVSEAITFESLVRGDHSLGSFLEQEGVNSVPSPANIRPGTSKYFAGKYWFYDQYRDLIDMVQVYAHKDNRDNALARQTFAENLANAVVAFYQEHYGNDILVHPETIVWKIYTFVIKQAQFGALTP